MPRLSILDLPSLPLRVFLSRNEWNHRSHGGPALSGLDLQAPAHLSHAFTHLLNTGTVRRCGSRQCLCARHSMARVNHFDPDFRCVAKHSYPKRRAARMPDGVIQALFCDSKEDQFAFRR